MRNLIRFLFLLIFICCLIVIVPGISVLALTPTLTPTPTQFATPTATKTPTPTPSVTPSIWPPVLTYAGSQMSLCCRPPLPYPLPYPTYPFPYWNDIEIYIGGRWITIPIPPYPWPLRPPLPWYITPPIFPDLSSTYDPNKDMTTLRWYNGEITGVQPINISWWTRSFIIFPKLLARYSHDGVPYIPIGPIFLHEFKPVAPNLINLTINNTPTDGGPITIGTLQIGPVNTMYTLSDLTWANLDSVTWSITESNISLGLNQSRSYTSIPMPSPAIGMIYRARMWLNSDPDNVVECIGQYTSGAWSANISYQVGDIVSYNGIYYRCRQAHTSQTSWIPPNSPTYWERIYGPSPTISPTPTVTKTPTATKTPTPSGGEAPAWQPNTFYAVGALVTYGGHTYKCIQSHTSLVGWEPPNVPALWQLVS